MSVFALILLSCEKEKAVFFPPELGELKVTEITDSSICAKCSVLKNNELQLQEIGFCICNKVDSSIVRYVKCENQETFCATISGLSPQTNYSIKAYAKNVAGTTYSESIISMTYSGYINEHPYIDLGLPSGTLWATYSIGAKKPEDYGDYFAWGEITTKETYNWNTYRYCNGDYNTLTKYCSNAEFGDNGFTDALTSIEASDDAATANWGAGWRMPTRKEMYELYSNCTHEWTNQNGVGGLLFTGPNGNSIFLPAAGWRYGGVLNDASSYGRYWSSSLSSVPYCANSLNFGSDYYDLYSVNRYDGRSVRAVCD